MPETKVTYNEATYEFLHDRYEVATNDAEAIRMAIQEAKNLADDRREGIKEAELQRSQSE